jgi:integrase
MNIKPLHIPINKRIRGLGLCVFCNHCGTVAVDECVESGKNLSTCKMGASHVFKQYIHTPGTKNKRVVKVIPTRDLNDAIKIAIDNKKSVIEEASRPHARQIEVPKEKEIQGVPQPILLVHFMAKYLRMLDGEGPAHRSRKRSKAYIYEVQRAFHLFTKCLKKNGYDPSTFSMEMISDDIAGMWYSFLKEEEYSGRTFNKYYGYMTSMTKWCIEKGNCNIKNWFEGADRQPVRSNPESITQEEFTALIDQIKPENSLYKYSYKSTVINRNMYHPFLAPAFKFLLHSGRRREEVINLKFSDVIEDGNGLVAIRTEDRKVNNIRGNIAKESKKIEYIPATQDICDLLLEAGYDKYKGTDKYIIAPELNIERDKLFADTLSKSFNFYYKQLDTGRTLGLKSCRKAYLTRLKIYLMGNVSRYSGHSNEHVIETHYLDKLEIAKALKGFRVFPDEIKRENELHTIRETKDIKTKKIDR